MTLSMYAQINAMQQWCDALTEAQLMGSAYSWYSPYWEAA